jgi:hypothetical protein
MCSYRSKSPLEAGRSDGEEVMAVFFGFLFLSSLAVWMGSVVFFGFIAGPDVTGTVSKEQSLRILSRMARPYLQLTWICGSLAFLSSFFLAPMEGTYVTMRIALTAVMFALSLYLAFGSGAKVRSAIRALEAAGDDEVPKEAMADFDAFQGTSSQVNGALLLLGLVVIFITAFYF